MNKDLLDKAKEIVANGCGCDRHCDELIGPDVVCGCERDAAEIIKLAQTDMAKMPCDAVATGTRLT